MNAFLQLSPPKYKADNSLRVNGTLKLRRSDHNQFHFRIQNAKWFNAIKMNLFVGLLLFSCTQKPTEKSSNHQAIVLHNSMVKKANHIEHHLNEIKKDPAINVDSIAVLSALLTQWKADLIEVPGNKNHDHKGHEHRHSSNRDLTDKQIFKMQQDLDERLSAIGKRISQLKANTHDHEHIH